MSDDLISRKAFIEYMNKNFERTPQVVTFIGIIAEQPVAFDKEKVTEELKQAAYWKASEPADSDGCIDDYCDSEIIDMDRAIEIVEKGGIE